MPQNVSFFNFSLSKILGPGQSILDKARTRLLYYGLLFAFFAYLAGTVLMVGRSGTPLIIIAIFVELSLIGLFKFLTWTGDWRKVSHALLIVITIVNLDYVYVELQTVNIITIQLIIITIQFSFYMLGKRYGAFYTLLNAIPILLFMTLVYRGDYVIHIKPAFNGVVSLITIVTNFILIIFIHTHFFTAFLNTIKQLKKTTELQAVLNQELAVAVQKSAASAEAKAEFLATMSHELRTPLNAVIGMTNLMIMSNPREDQQENLDVLKFSAGNLMAIVNDVLDFNNIEIGNIRFEETVFNLGELMAGICEPNRHKAAAKGLNFHLHVDEFLEHHELSGDIARITQIVNNLVNNAVKFTLQGDIWVNITCAELYGKHVKVNFAIKDTGIGIKTENLDLIFEAFSQESMSATRQYGGTGLGLAIVKRLLQLQNSAIKVKSGINYGSEFSFDMDFAVAVLQDKSGCLAEIFEEKEKLQENTLGHIRVLVAEDNAVNITLMKKLLSRWNISPTFAENGYKVVDLIKNEDFDIVLMDLQMPLVNGFEAAAEIRKIKDQSKASIPIIALSASAFSEIREKVTAVGMNDYLAKPFKPEQLKQKMQQLLQLA